MDHLEFIQKDTGSEPSAAVIWLHGLGADGYDFEPVVPQLRWENAPDIRFIFPHAPRQAVTVNAGMVMRAWYDIRSLDFEKRVDEPGIRSSAAQVSQILTSLKEQGIGLNRTVLAGFSQGGALALHLGLRQPEPLAGIIALSCALPLPDALDKERMEGALKTPIMVAHGQFDDIVPIGLGELSADRLIGWGYQVEWRSYQVAHGVAPDEIEHIRLFLMRVLGDENC